MHFSIRIAKECDFQRVFELNRDFSVFIKTPEKFRITVNQMKKEKDLFKILVVDTPEAGIVGFATTFFAWYSWSGKSLYLDDLYIMEKYRKNGLGSRLMEEVFELARKEGCKKIRWQVSRWNNDAIEFYRKKGAVIDDVEINCELVL
jgi:diamine N-acetyltransferase